MPVKIQELLMRVNIVDKKDPKTNTTLDLPNLAVCDLNTLSLEKKILNKLRIEFYDENER